MAEAKDYIWLCPFIGAILTGISLFTPAAYEIGGLFSSFVWMTGFMVVTGGAYGPEPYIFDELIAGEVIPGYIIPGIIATVFITIFTITLFVSALTHRKKETPASWIVFGIFLIIGVIIYAAGVEIGVGTYWSNQGAPYHISFWNDYDYSPGFAVVAPIIGGILALLGGIIGKAMGRGEVIGKPKAVPQVEKPVPVAETPPPIPTPTPATEEAKVVRFCPECGTKIEQADATFCSVCGHKF